VSFIGVESIKNRQRMHERRPSSDLQHHVVHVIGVIKILKRYCCQKPGIDRTLTHNKKHKETKKT